jgi:hypothetical protein
VRYVRRYMKRPMLVEGHIAKFERRYVTNRFEDYHKGGVQSFKKLPVRVFMDRLRPHLPEPHYRQVRHYGLFANAKRNELLRKARQLLAQIKKRRPKP